MQYQQNWLPIASSKGSITVQNKIGPEENRPDEAPI
jgi:hypothetical protein